MPDHLISDDVGDRVICRQQQIHEYFECGVGGSDYYVFVEDCGFSDEYCVGSGETITDDED